MCFYCKFPVLLNGMWAFTIKLMLLWTMNEGIGFTHFNTGSISFKTWYIYCDQAKDVYMSRLQVFSICPTIEPLNQVIIFSFHQILQKSNLNTTFFSWLASQRPFVTGFKISEFDHFKKSFVLYYWKKKMKSACGPEISLVQNIF